MSAIELATEKIKSLSEPAAKSVLAYIAIIEHAAAPTARELMLLPRAERGKILAKQAASAAEIYRDDPNLICEDFDPPMDYE